MNTDLHEIFEARGLSAMSASIKTGIPYVTISQHLRGVRGISPDMALKYERLLGIPRSELRPDLWPPADRMPETELAEN